MIRTIRKKKPRSQRERLPAVRTRTGPCDEAGPRTASIATEIPSRSSSRLSNVTKFSAPYCLKPPMICRTEAVSLCRIEVPHLLNPPIESETRAHGLDLHAAELEALAQST